MSPEEEARNGSWGRISFLRVEGEKHLRWDERTVTFSGPEALGCSFNWPCIAPAPQILAKDNYPKFSALLSVLYSKWEIQSSGVSWVTRMKDSGSLHQEWGRLCTRSGFHEPPPSPPTRMTTPEQFGLNAIFLNSPLGKCKITRELDIFLQCFASL